MPDKLIISNLELSCRLGVYEREQAAPQPVWVDLEVEIDARRAAAQDDVREALDYARLVSLVKQRVESQAFHLLETMAEQVAALILQDTGSREVTVRVKKRALPNLEYAAVEITRRAGESRRP